MTRGRSFGDRVSCWIFPEADPETRIPLQVVYLREPRREQGPRGQEGGKAYRRVHAFSSSLLQATGSHFQKSGRRVISTHPPQVEGALEALAPILPGWVNPPRARAWSGLCDSELPEQLWLKSPGNRRPGHRAPLSSPACNNPAHPLSLPLALLPPGIL